MLRSIARFLGGVLLVARCAAAHGEIDPEKLQACAAIDDPESRLACFDRLVPRAPGTASPAATAAPAAVVLEAREDRSLIGDRWSIGVSSRDNRFDVRPHKPSYFLPGRYSGAPNRLPTSPGKQPLAAPLDIEPVESKFQVSFKVKLADFDESIGGSVWTGYTQQSQWQVYNASVSRPFRETNYEPELMLAFHPDREIVGWHWRLLVVGLDHQSNGRSDPLSRSWNRVYVQFGLEQGNFALLLRPWWRLPESRARDDNSDITRYLGYGDMVALYRWGAHTVSALGRYNAVSHKGALMLAWNFPLARRVRGYVQAFSGYGESLIDYNVPQNTIGIGISLADHL